MSAKLICLDAVSIVNEVDLATLPLTIGRSLDADIRLDDGWVSRIHCEISKGEDDGVLVLRDLESSHGTLVNGQPVLETVLNPGDKVSIGTSTFLVAFLEIPSVRSNLAAVQSVTD